MIILVNDKKHIVSVREGNDKVNEMYKLMKNGKDVLSDKDKLSYLNYIHGNGTEKEISKQGSFDRVFIRNYSFEIFNKYTVQKLYMGLITVGQTSSDVTFDLYDLSERKVCKNIFSCNLVDVFENGTTINLYDVDIVSKLPDYYKFNIITNKYLKDKLDMSNFDEDDFVNSQINSVLGK